MRTRLMCGIRMVAMLAMLAMLASVARTQDATSVDDILDAAENLPDRDSQVAYLRKALDSRGPDPENLKIEFAIATELSQHSSPKFNQTLKPQEGLPIYERILTTYDYDAYYLKIANNGLYHDPQSLMVQAAIQASGLHSFMFHSPEKGREYAHMAMQLLDRTFQRRKQDWLDDPRPVFNAGWIPEGSSDGHRTPEVNYAIELARWEKQQATAREGKVFGQTEMTSARITVEYYGQSYGRLTPDRVAEVMNGIIEEFPGTPMAEFAAGHIEKAAQLALKGAAHMSLERDIKEIVEAEALAWPTPVEAVTAARPAEAPADATKPTYSGVVASAAPVAAATAAGPAKAASTAAALEGGHGRRSICGVSIIVLIAVAGLASIVVLLRSRRQVTRGN